MALPCILCGSTESAGSVLDEDGSRTLCGLHAIAELASGREWTIVLTAPIPVRA